MCQGYTTSKALKFLWRKYKTKETNKKEKKGELVCFYTNP
jgi:hypothetical protein